jgi:hypothetical protein
MIPAEEFRKRAAECELMAKFTRDPQSKDTWRRMAERWTRCAETFAEHSSAAQHHDPGTRHRKPSPGWARHH